MTLTLTTVSAVLSQVLLTLNPETQAPLRFGFPLPADKIESGLRLIGTRGARLQWRVLGHRPDPQTGRVWCELCITGARGRVQIAARGDGPVGPSGGPVVAFETRAVETPTQHERVLRWRWHTGEVDEVRHLRFRVAQSYPPAPAADPAVFAAGESLHLGCVPERFTRAGISARAWRRAGLLPPGGRLGRTFRRHLLATVGRLAELPGLRDRGDYRRGPKNQPLMTNLEFDTSLAFARLGMAEGQPKLLARAFASATHSADHDLDARTHLQYSHGQDHRSTQPDPGHTWLTGILLVGCLAADENLIATAGRIAHGLARQPPSGEGYRERVRDVGWPLAEMEAWLGYADSAEVEMAAAALVRQVGSKWNKTNRVFEFGEGRRSRGVYDAPLWVTAGSLLPGLRAYVRRTGDRRLSAMIRETERRIDALCRNGKPGVPVRYLVAAGKVFRQSRVEGRPSAFMLLEGLAPSDLQRCLGRRQIRGALAKIPRSDDQDLATSWTIAGRCWWLYR